MATIHITTPAGLQNMESDLTADYIIDNNLDMTGFAWTPVGLMSPFIGTLNGQNFIISNLTIHDAANVWGTCAIFAEIDEPAVIRNVGLDNINLIGNNKVSLIAGVTFGEVTVSNVVATRVTVTQDDQAAEINNVYLIRSWHLNNCSVQCTINLQNYDQHIFGVAPFQALGIVDNNKATGTITINTGGSNGYCLGICGFSNGGDINTVVTNCYTNVSMNLTYLPPVSGNYNFQGIAGFMGGASNSRIYNCYATGDINITTNIDANCQSINIAGFVAQTASFASIEKCYCSGNITIVNTATVPGAVEFTDFLGGFVGEMDSGPSTIKNCYTLTNISVSGASSGINAGGFVYFIYHGVNIINSYAAGNVTLASTAASTFSAIGGFVGHIFGTAAKVINCYSVGIVTKGVGDPDLYIGGFCGFIDTQDSFIINCSWFTLAYNYAIGQGPFPTYAEWTNNVSHYYAVGDIFWAYNDYPYVGRTITPPPFWGPAGGKTVFRVIVAGTSFELVDDAGFGDTGFAATHCVIIGHDLPVGVHIPLLNPSGYSYITGTDEPDNTKFYSRDHAVYAEG